MEHVVFFPAHDGTPAFRRVAGLEDAVRLVEHLRNVESVSEVSVHALSEVPLSFRTVIKVEMPGVAPDVAAPAADPLAHAADVPAPEVPMQALPSEGVPVLMAVQSPLDAAEQGGPADEPSSDAADPDVPSAPAVVSARRQGARSLGFFS